MLKKFIACFLIFVLTCVGFGCSGGSGEQKIACCDLVFQYENDQIIASVTYSNFSHLVKNNGLLLNLYPNKQNQKSGQITPLTALLNEKEIDFELLGDYNEYMLLSGDFKNDDRLQINFQTVVEEGNGRLSKNGDTINLAYFYPQLCAVFNGEVAKYPFISFGDPFFDVWCDYNISLTLPSVMAVACGANPLSVEVNGDKTTYNYTLKRAKTFALNLSSNYMVASKKWGYKRVNYYYYSDNAPEKRLESIICYLDYFSNKIGEYAFDVFSVAQSDYYVGGMEYPAFCVVDGKLLNEDFNYCILHEVAHQWFGIGVDFNQFQNAWIDEGLAECLSMIYLKENDPKNYNQRLLYTKSLINAFERAVGEGKISASGNIFRSLDKFNGEYEYFLCVYKKSALYFLQRYEELGDKRFFKMLSKIYADYRGKDMEKSSFTKYFN